jgi:23S rRNA (uridine2552-2'-O)-methyltransferase
MVCAGTSDPIVRDAQAEGRDAIDQPRSIHLAELALDFSRPLLKPNGAVLIKTIQGAGFKELVESARRSLIKVRFAKPDASRARSSEL